MIVVILFLVLLLSILSLIVLQSADEGLLPVVLHLDQLGVGLERRDGDWAGAEASLAVYITTAIELLYLQIVEALMHQEVNADHLVELIDSKPSNSLENAEENCAENDAPEHYDDASEALSLNH